MLRKLFKYDWKSVSPLLFILHGILLLYTILERIAISIGSAQSNTQTASSASEFSGIAGALYVLGFIFFIIAIIIATYLYLAVHMQKNLFSDEGYLTHTLPVSPVKLLWSKILVFNAWILLDILCVVISIAILVIYPDTLTWILEDFQFLLHIFLGSAGFQNQLSIILTVLNVIVLYLGYYTMLLFFALCLGNLFKNHKVLGSVLSFFGVNIILSIIKTIILFLVPALNPFTISFSSDMATQEMVTSSDLSFSGLPIIGFSLLWDLIFAVLFFLGSRYIISKRLNLQ